MVLSTPSCDSGGVRGITRLKNSRAYAFPEVTGQIYVAVLAKPRAVLSSLMRAEKLQKRRRAVLPNSSTTSRTGTGTTANNCRALKNTAISTYAIECECSRWRLHNHSGTTTTLPFTSRLSIRPIAAGTSPSEIRSLTTGFTVSLLPRIISGERILMDYSINLSSLVALTNQTSGGQTIQLPTTDSDQGMQETELRSGQVLMLNGYISDSAADTRQGTGAPGNFLLGGTRSASTAKKRIIVTMEPVITSGGES